MDWIRKNHIIWKKIGITAGVYLGMKYLVPLLIPFFIAALLVCWCWPLLQWAQRRLRIKPAFVMAVLLILAAALLAGLGIWLGKSIGELARRLAEMFTKPGTAENILYECCDGLSEIGRAHV